MSEHDHDLDYAVSEFQSVEQGYLARLLSIEHSRAWIFDWAGKRLELSQNNSAATRSLRDLINLLNGKPELSLPKLSSALETLPYDHYSDLIAGMGSRPEATEAETTCLEKRLQSLSVEILDKCEPRAKAIAAKISARFRKEPEGFRSLFFLSLRRAIHQWRSGAKGNFIAYYAAVAGNALINDEYDQLLIRIPRRDFPDVRRLLDEIEKFTRAEGCQPTNEELAVALNVSTTRIRTLQAQIYLVVSLDAPLSEEPDAGALHGVIPSELALSYKGQEGEAAIRSCLAKLLASERPPQPDHDGLPFDVEQDFGLLLGALPLELLPVVKSTAQPFDRALLRLMQIGFQNLKQSLEDEKKLVYPARS